jgi:hypothetical protein
MRFEATFVHQVELGSNQVIAYEITINKDGNNATCREAKGRREDEGRKDR